MPGKTSVTTGVKIEGKKDAVIIFFLLLLLRNLNNLNIILTLDCYLLNLSSKKVW